MAISPQLPRQRLRSISQCAGRNPRAARGVGWCFGAISESGSNAIVVPFNSFSEYNKGEGGDIWFALDETRPLACFAGIWTNWTSVRKVREGETVNELYAFLTTEPNAEVGAVHPKAMPVILTTPDEVEIWMTAPPDEALKLQRPLPDGTLRIVAKGAKEDPGGTAPK
jgi:putative SOS response-associated peptidase YedK